MKYFDLVAFWNKETYFAISDFLAKGKKTPLPDIVLVKTHSLTMVHHILAAF